MDLELLARQIARDHYGFEDLTEIKSLPQGRVNFTFLLVTGKRKSILQRLNPVFGADGTVVENSAFAARSLTAAGLRAPDVQPTTSGSLAVQEQGVWRLTAFLSGAVGKRGPSLGVEVARYLGLAHRAWAMDPPAIKALPAGEFRPDPINARRSWQGLIEKYKSRPEFMLAAPSLEWGGELIAALPEIIFSTTAIVHGDPKWENFLFDKDKCSALIDLDTVGPGFLLWELADALRSWAGRRSDEQEPRLDQDTFRQSALAYGTWGLELKDAEWSALPWATALVSLNLARRYLIDFFERSYFTWDEDKYPSLAEQNLERGGDYLALAQEILVNGPTWPPMENIG